MSNLTSKGTQTFGQAADIVTGRGAQHPEAADVGQVGHRRKSKNVNNHFSKNSNKRPEENSNWNPIQNFPRAFIQIIRKVFLHIFSTFDDDDGSRENAQKHFSKHFQIFPGCSGGVRRCSGRVRRCPGRFRMFSGRSLRCSVDFFYIVLIIAGT